MEDEEMEDPTQKDPNTLSVHTNSHMQPSSPLLGHSMDMIELDEKQNFAVYAGPGRGQTEENTPNGNGLDQNNPENNGANEADDRENDTEDGKVDDTAGKKERCTSSVVMEIGKGGRVLSVSDGDEAQSPTFTKEVNVAIGEENETHDDDSAFADPPHSPLGAVRAPLASEENILASLGPKEMEDDPADRPGGFDDEGKDRESNRSRSSSSSSSKSKSSKSSNEEVTEM
ncbi:uncharacterized protein LOC132725326 [Ruditapes philippinarum]|uniref:uncharacterized protein LOC132725326 n=1 Tax=Ruditapes philippinarum TaxID=129788 RepID=UPI00295B3541|nr:uncharacterized protein LOC132725326 [Ruditapes philippinarum]